MFTSPPYIEIWLSISLNWKPSLSRSLVARSLHMIYLGYKLKKKDIYWEDIELSCRHQGMWVSGFYGNLGKQSGSQAESSFSSHSSGKTYSLLFISSVCLLYSVLLIFILLSVCYAPSTVLGAMGA